MPPALADRDGEREETVTTGANPEGWLEGYGRAWTTNDPADIARLSAADATSATAPYREPCRGREVIVAGWLEHRDEPGRWAFRHRIVTVAVDLGVVRDWTTYAGPPTAHVSPFAVRLDPAGRCAEFTGRWMEEQ